MLTEIVGCLVPAPFKLHGGIIASTFINIANCSDMRETGATGTARNAPFIFIYARPRKIHAPLNRGLEDYALRIKRLNAAA